MKRTRTSTIRAPNIFVLVVLLVLVLKKSSHHAPATRNPWFDSPFDGLTVLSEVEGQHATLKPNYT
jgi:hypothetical protein